LKKTIVIQDEAEVIRTADEWDRAMVSNDADDIGRFMADDWTIIGPDGKVGGRESFLAFIRSGDLTHDVMESHDMTIRLYGDVAVVIACGISGGKYREQVFSLTERVSCVFVKQNGEWKCVSTHLSAIAE
jgi:ketosteroid isomerase-like protein